MSTDDGREAVQRKSEKNLKEEVIAEKRVSSMLPAAIVITLLSGLVYIPSLHGSMIWDDAELLSGKGIGNAVSIPQCFMSSFLYHYYRPLTSASFILDHHIWDHGVWGSNTFGYHLTNLLLHVLTTALLFPILLLAFRSRSVALWGSLLFAIQPAQVSAVAWIGGRTDSLCTLFIALLFLTLISGAKSAGMKRVWLLAASIACYALAALAKEQALFLLPLAPMAAYVFRSTPASIRAVRTEMIICSTLFTSAAACLLTAWARFGHPLLPKWNLLHQLPLIGPTIDYYTLLLVTPTPRLNHIMTLYSMEKLGVIGIVAGYAVGTLAIAVVIRLMRSEPTAAWFFTGVLLLLAPVSNIYPMTTQTIAPYRAGTAGLCAAAVVGWVIVKLLERGQSVLSTPARSKLIALPICMYASWFCCLTYLDDEVWKNSLTASTAVERYDPDSVFGRLETANAYLEFGSFEPAVSRLDKVSITIVDHPDSAARSDIAASWNSKNSLADRTAALYGRAGLLKLVLGDRQSAISVLNKGKAMSPKNDQVNTGLAYCALAVNDYAGAEGPIRNVLAAQPDLAGLRLRLGKFLVRQRRWKDADTELTICLSQTPNNTTICLLTAMARIQEGNRIGAAALLTDGVKRHVLELNKLHYWLKMIGEPGLLNPGEMQHDNR